MNGENPGNLERPADEQPGQQPPTRRVRRSLVQIFLGKSPQPDNPSKRLTADETLLVREEVASELRKYVALLASLLSLLGIGLPFLFSTYFTNQAEKTLNAQLNDWQPQIRKAYQDLGEIQEKAKAIRDQFEKKSAELGEEFRARLSKNSDEAKTAITAIEKQANRLVADFDTKTMAVNEDIGRIKKLADQGATQTADELSKRQDFLASVSKRLFPVPVGAILPFVGRSNELPTDYMECAGQELERASYPELFAAIGTRWGNSDEGHFRLPDLRGRVVVGAGRGPQLALRELGKSDGEESHSLSIEEMPKHDHPVEDPGHKHPQNVTTPPEHEGGGRAGRRDYATDAAPAKHFTVLPHEIETDAAATNIRVAMAGLGAAHNNMQPFAVCTYMIRCK